MPKQRQEWIYISVGLFMALSFMALLFLIFQVSGIRYLSKPKTYTVYANFNDIGSLRVHAPVTVSGVKVGEVAQIKLDSQSLNARVALVLEKSKAIPFDDVSARILTEGLLGANYISIIPGFDAPESKHSFLQAGDEIAKTQDAMILENLIGQLLFNAKK
ncbi:MAG: outer membrane lipid asymmetry maintenance protein MlaD [Gammaproteobacteria bacterium]|nr:outer membrane lipid asymmetry maintenance protein MlaD [Gammaproteobacteria bacterium]